MTDNEIIKALECCVKDDCHKCERFKVGDSRIEHKDKMLSDALDLINRQQTEIDFLRASDGLDKTEFNELKAELELKKAEIERLKSPKFLVEKTLSEKELSEMLKKGRTGVIPHINYSIKRIDEDGIKSEAIKEFAERFTKEVDIISDIDVGFAYQITKRDFDNLVKEMVGDTE